MTNARGPGGSEWKDASRMLRGWECPVARSARGTITASARPPARRPAKNPKIAAMNGIKVRKSSGREDTILEPRFHANGRSSDGKAPPGGGLRWTTACLIRWKPLQQNSLEASIIYAPAHGITRVKKTRQSPDIFRDAQGPRGSSPSSSEAHPFTAMIEGRGPSGRGRRMRNSAMTRVLKIG
jgi:hypothetical protein